MIAKPHIVTLLCKVERRRLSTIHDPIFSWSEKPMLHKNHWRIWFEIRGLYSKETEYVAIIRRDMMALVVHPLIVRKLEYRLEEIRMLTL